MAGLDSARFCAGCGKPLSRYNAGDRCQACVSSQRTQQPGGNSGNVAEGAKLAQLRPGWARRIAELRRSRAWSPADLACELKKLRDGLPSVRSLAHMIQLDWETGKHRPGPRYRLLLAAVYALDEHEIFADIAGPALAEVKHREPA
jgi:hypothetical protein